MNSSQSLISSSAEYVSAGHPDKIADQIADAIFDQCLSLSKFNQVACEVLAAKKLIVIAGEFTVDHNFDSVSIAKNVIKKYGYDPDSFEYVVNITSQSKDIRDSVVKKDLIFSGDQGIIFGYACNETEEYLPLCFVIARDLIWKTQRLIEEKKLPWAKWDMKSAVTLMKNSENDKYWLDTLIFSVQHTKDVSNEDIKAFVKENIIDQVVDKHGLSTKIKNLFINSSGRFEIGGLDADTGVTNRKLMVDAAGPIARHGGGGFSGKDLSKVDRSGAYYARWICKNLVAAGIVSWVELKLIYYLGAEKPLNYYLKLPSDSKYTEEEIVDCINNVFPQTIDQIINWFLTHKVSYENLAGYGHFGRLDLNLPWENLDKVTQIKTWLKKT